MVSAGPQVPSFVMLTITYPLPQARVSGLRTGGFFCFGDAEGFGSLYLYLSMYCFLTSRGYVILGARRGGLFEWTRGV